MSEQVMRAVLTAGTLGVFGLGAVGMWWGWRRRAHRQRELLPLPVAPDGHAEPLLPLARGLYVGTTLAGDWQARVVVGELSDRSAATLTLSDVGLAIHRAGASTVFVPARALRDARLDSALAGKVIGPAGLLVVTWEHRGQLLDTAFRADSHAVHAPYLHAVLDLLPAIRPAAPADAAERPAVHPFEPPAEPTAVTSSGSDQ